MVAASHNHYAAYARSRRTVERDLEFQRVVDEAKAQHNLSDIVGRHTALRRRGHREMVGLCPFHQERTPSFEVNDAKGTYHCWGCGAGGDAIRFLIDMKKMTFRQAVETLSGEEFPVISEQERVRRREEDAADTAKRIALARSIWSRSGPAHGTWAEAYARSRGITAPLPPTVRFVETPRWYNDETGEMGRNVPAMVCALQDATDAIVGVQCIFLQNGGRQKFSRPRKDGTVGKAKLTFGVIVGSALRLGAKSPNIVICEGPEDGLSLAQELPARTIWVSCGTALMSRVDLPDVVRHVTLAGDNGSAGRAAVAAAKDAYLQAGRTVSEVFPRPEFKDWNDQLCLVRHD